MRRNAPLMVFSDIGLVALRMLGKIYWSFPVHGWIDSKISITWDDKGTICGSRIFIFLLGMRHSFFSKSISCHSA